MATCSPWGRRWCLPSTSFSLSTPPGRQGWQQITVVQVAVTALLMIVTVPSQRRFRWSGRRAVIWGIGITGFLSLALAFAIQAWAQQFTPATHTALIFTLEPVFAWLTSFIFLGERLGRGPGLGRCAFWPEC